MGAPFDRCPVNFRFLSLNMVSPECLFSVGEPPRDLWLLFHLYVGQSDINPMFVLVIYHRKVNSNTLGNLGTPFSMGMIRRGVYIFSRASVGHI